MRKDFREALREVRKWKPVRDIFPSAGQRIEVMVTGKELFSEINSRVPSPDVIDYLREISSNLPRMSEMTIVVDDEVDFDRVVRTYRSYIAFSLKRSAEIPYRKDPVLPGRGGRTARHILLS